MKTTPLIAGFWLAQAGLPAPIAGLAGGFVTFHGSGSRVLIIVTETGMDRRHR